MSGKSTSDFAQIVDRVAKLAASKGAFVSKGPPVTLAAHQVLPLSLPMHELATNALKHGALSADGRVEVTWSGVDSGETGALLSIDWRESGGPRVTPPTRSGFGSELINHTINYDLNGTVETHFDLDGFRGCFSVPIG